MYRPVPAVSVQEKVFKLLGEDIYDSDDEDWEFGPGSLVHIEPRELEGVSVYIAVKPQSQ